MKREKKSQAEVAETILDQGSQDGTRSMLTEILRSWGLGLSFWRRLISEVGDMTVKNPYLEKIRAPIVLIAGASDSIVDHKRIVPEAEVQRLRKEMEEGPNQRKDLAAREAFLKKHMFPNSPFVRMLVPEKMGNHLVQIFRPDAVAKATLFSLEQYYRRKRKTTP